MPKVHILSDTEANKELGEEVMKLLKKSKGPLSYKTSSLEIKEDTHRVVEFEDLFDICKNFRENSNAVKPYSVKPNDFVILLSPKPNMKNWFSALDFKNNIFVHTDGWDKYCEQQPKFPIAHEIISNIVHSKLFKNNEEILNGVHSDPVGCLNDFCGNKEHVIKKLRKGTVCEACKEKIEETFKDSNGFLDQINRTLHSISFAFTRLSEIVDQKPISRIEINGEKELKFTDYNNKELKFESAIDKVLYILFLKHKDGLEYVDFPDMELEITELYFKHVPSNKGLAKIEKTISNLCMPLSELRNQAKSRVNGRLEATLGSTLAVHYKIVQNPETLVHSIKLPAEFRVFKD
jgi:hypothetical protein